MLGMSNPLIENNHLTRLYSTLGVPQTYLKEKVNKWSPKEKLEQKPMEEENENSKCQFQGLVKSDFSMPKCFCTNPGKYISFQLHCGNRWRSHKGMS